ncbi:hypothetical protein CBR_g55424 [Chara braunii]|uniref:Uncharacterized protein n=1 Tax=Chara braunii TaxID=69332 RepID=A0A388K7R9_CHABU|nr:hypothetical protein CBR_g55424 [Chara braunii]|eukprot:GBG66081.1 hypothetical protein CBR_g55424 [Chara braunii]
MEYSVLPRFITPLMSRLSGNGEKAFRGATPLLRRYSFHEVRPSSHRHRVDLIVGGHIAKAEEKKANLKKEREGILGRTTRLEETLKKIWEVGKDPEVEEEKAENDGYDRALMGIMGEEEEELRQLLDNQPLPPPPPGGAGQGASRNRSNGFVPIGSAQWLESMMGQQQDRGWVGNGFNNLAPINVKGWKFLADLSKNEVEECRRKALAGTLDYANATPHFGDKLTFPTLSVLDPTKCVFANPVVMQKLISSFLSLDLRNLRRVWNVGHPYLKCRCGYRNSHTCNGGPIWFDQAIWYLMAKPEILKPEAGSNRVRIAFLLHHLHTSWRELAKASVTFIWMREMMLTVLRNLERNPGLMTADALAGSTFKIHACPRILANLILPTRITPGLPAPEIPNPKKKKNRSPIGVRNKKAKGSFWGGGIPWKADWAAQAGGENNYEDVASSIDATLDYGGDSGGSCFYGFGGLFGPGSDFWGRIVKIGDTLYAEPEPDAPSTDGTLMITGGDTTTTRNDGGTAGGSAMDQSVEIAYCNRAA